MSFLDLVAKAVQVGTGGGGLIGSSSRNRGGQFSEFLQGQVAPVRPSVISASGWRGRVENGLAVFAVPQIDQTKQTLRTAVERQVPAAARQFEGVFEPAQLVMKLRRLDQRHGLFPGQQGERRTRSSVSLSAKRSASPFWADSLKRMKSGRMGRESGSAHGPAIRSRSCIRVAELGVNPGEELLHLGRVGGGAYRRPRRPPVASGSPHSCVA